MLSRSTKVIRADTDCDPSVRIRAGYLELVLPSKLCDFQGYLPPLVDLSIPENAFLWYKVRLVARQTGSRFSLRLQIYVTIMLLIILAMNVIFLFRFIAVGAAESVSDFQSVLLVAEVAYMDLSVATFVILMILYGSMANSESYKQSELLIKALIRLEELIRVEKTDSSTREEMQASLQALRSVNDAVQIDDKMEPIKIFGIPASPLIFRGFATGIATMLAAIIGRMMVGS